MSYVRMSLLGLALLAVNISAQDDKPKNLVLNGSFEDSVDVPENPGFLPLDKGNDGIKGWTITRGQIDLINNYWKAADGKRSLDLNGSPGVGGVKQTLPTVKGKKYKLSFQLAGNPSAPVKKEITVEVGELKKSFDFDTTGKTLEDLGWKLIELEFTATGDKTDLELYSSTADTENSGPALDDLKVVEVK